MSLLRSFSPFPTPLHHLPFNSCVPTVGRVAPACHLFLLLPQPCSGGGPPLLLRPYLSKCGLGGRGDGSCSHKPEAPDRTTIANRRANSGAVHLGVQGQVLPLALPRDAWNRLPLSSPTLSVPFMGLPAPFPSPQSHRADQSLCFPGRNHILFPAGPLEWDRTGWLSEWRCSQMVRRWGCSSVSFH